MFGLIRMGAAVPRLKIADCQYNAEEIIKNINDAAQSEVKILTLPELCITGYSCGDLFHQRSLLKSAEAALASIAEATKDYDMLVAVGLPVAYGNQLFNAVAMLHQGVILGIVPKAFLQNERQFASAFDNDFEYVRICGADVPFGTDLIFRAADIDDLAIAVEVGGDSMAPLPAGAYMALNGANLILNPAAFNEEVSAHAFRKRLAKSRSAACVAGYVCASAGIYESTQDMVFGGTALIAENGALVAEAERFALNGSFIYADIDIELLTSERRKNPAFVHKAELPAVREVSFEMAETDVEEIKRTIRKNPFVLKSKEKMDVRCEEIFKTQCTALVRRMLHTNSKAAVVGISGGLDSTLALLVTAKAFDMLGLDKKNLVGITMPGFGTTDRTYNNALDLMKALGVTVREISIVPAITQHFADIDHDIENRNVAYENAQARERTQILMDVANDIGGLVIGTGDLSELALGWATYNGDHMSMYGVNAGVPKTVVQRVVRWVSEKGGLDEKAAAILHDVLDTPISPELLPPTESGEINQKTEDIVGPYELHDFFLYYVVRCGFEPAKIYAYAKKAWEDEYDDATILKWMKNFYRRFFSQQFKRSCMPDGPMVGSVTLSPRGGWQMPTDAVSKIWLDEAEGLQ